MLQNNNFILLAEDDEDDQELIRLVFERVTTKHAFEIVSNGAELLQKLTAHSTLPCLIILDLNMPVLNGIQTLEALNNHPEFEKVPKIILTTSDHEDSKATSFSKGAVDFFVKPSNMKDFMVTAKKMLTYCE